MIGSLILGILLCLLLSYFFSSSELAYSACNRLRLENAQSEALGQKANYVLWCRHSFPADLLLEIDFHPVREPGLAMLFFSASGILADKILCSILSINFWCFSFSIAYFLSMSRRLSGTVPASVRFRRAFPLQTPPARLPSPNCPD